MNNNYLTLVPSCKELGLTREQIAFGIEARGHIYRARATLDESRFSIFEAGRKLTALKLSVPRGKFMEACKVFLGGSHSTATRYMQIYDAVTEHLRLKVSADDDLTPSQQAEISDAVSMIRGPLKRLIDDGRVYRERMHQKNTPAKITAEEKVQARIEMQNAIVARASEALALIRDMESGDIGLLPRECWESILSDCVQTAKFVRPLLRSWKKKRK